MSGEKGCMLTSRCLLYLASPLAHMDAYLGVLMGDILNIMDIVLQIKVGNQKLTCSFLKCQFFSAACYDAFFDAYSSSLQTLLYITSSIHRTMYVKYKRGAKD